MKCLSGLFAALRFFTVLPVPRFCKSEWADMPNSMYSLPMVGALIGLAAAGLSFLFYRLFEPTVAGVLTVLALVGLQGGLHLDGLADTADGFLSCRPRERILEIMKDSRIGTFGVAAIVFTVALQIAALETLAPAWRFRAVFFAPLAGRCLMAPLLAVLPAARPGGMGAMFGGGHIQGVAIAALGVMMLAGWLLRGARGLLVVAGLGILFLLFAGCCRRKIGGYTGDTLGAVSELGETLALILF